MRRIFESMRYSARKTGAAAPPASWAILLLVVTQHALPSPAGAEPEEFGHVLQLQPQVEAISVEERKLADDSPG